jgi:choloylglycine hydrolase
MAMCLNFKVPTAADGAVVVGRSMEFPMMPTQLAVLPVGYEGVSSVAGVRPLTWTSRYGIVGMAALGQPQTLFDGMNTEGLTAHDLYMPGGYAHYSAPVGDGTDLGQTDLVPYLLGTCATTEEVEAAVHQLTIVGLDPGMGLVPPIHCFLHDRERSIVVEFHPDEVRVVDNPTGVGTNAPYLDWHLTNLSNYLGASVTGPHSEHRGGVDLRPLGQGQGLDALPPGFGPAARFVRAFFLLGLADQPGDDWQAELLALHVLNTFDIVPGTIKETVGGTVLSEVTEWDVVMNLTSRRYAYRTFSDPNVHVVDFASVDFDAPARIQDLSRDGAFLPALI